jgi:hypothetical protein
MSNRAFSVSTLAAFLVGAACALPAAAAMTCPPGEEAHGMPEKCVKKYEPKPQLDVEKYSGAQKAQAQACNKANAAHDAIMHSTGEITRINTSLDTAQYEASKLPKGPEKDAAKAKVTELKTQRKAEEKTLS